MASYNNETEVVFLKVVRMRKSLKFELTKCSQVSNTGPDDLVGNIVLDFATPGYATAISLGTPALSPITGSFNISNTIEEPEQITPVASSFTFQDPTRFNYTFPATSVTVLAVQSINFNSSSS